MVSITASTTHSIKKKKPSASGSGTNKKTSSKTAPRRGSIAPPLKPATLNTAQALDQLSSKTRNDQKVVVDHLFLSVLGERSVVELDKPHVTSTSRNRGAAAADVAMAADKLGVAFVLKECQILEQMQRILFPRGIEQALQILQDTKQQSSSLKPSLSAASLVSLDDSTTVPTINSRGTDSKRGKTTAPNAREGCLLLIRALCEIVGKPVEPFVVGAFLVAAVDECGSSSLPIRQAAEDCSKAIISTSHVWSLPGVMVPLLLQSLASSTEWRVKTCALERLSQCTQHAPEIMHKLIPQLVPAITNQVWDTKPQVSKAAQTCLQDICNTNTNPDIRPALPAIVQAICKPSETGKAVSELLSTTFVVPVDASTLAILCPVLARTLKEKLAQDKRAACVVIRNMSKLVYSPADIAPFSNLLLPNLQKVATTMQFEDIRNEALSALASLTQALGDYYTASAANENAQQQEQAALDMQTEQARVQAEQEQMEQERLEALQKEQETKLKEEEERKQFKQAMDAQRQLDQAAAIEAANKRAQEEKKREAQKLSTKSATGKCQGCGLKRCKKTCMFYTGK